MKIKPVATIAISTALLGTLAFSAEVSWTGGGTTAAWDDTGNWGGSLPTASDIAVISGVVPATSADITTMNGFGGVKIDGEESKIVASGITSSKISMTVPLSGTGTFCITNNTQYVVLNNDNSAFDGTIYTDGAGLELQHANAAGNSNTKLFIKNGSTSKYFQAPPASKCKSFAGVATFAKAEVYTRPSGGGFTYSGTIDVQDGTVNFRTDNGETYMSHYSGLITNTTSNSSEFRLTYCHRLEETGVIALGDNSIINLFNSGVFQVAGRIASAKSFIINNGLAVFHGENRLAQNLTVTLGNHQYPRKAKIDLNGLDQQCGNLQSQNADGDSKNYHQYADTSDPSVTGTYITPSSTDTGYITSPRPATFTVLGTYATTPDNSNFTIFQRRRFIYPIQGHVSFELNSTNQATAATIRFSSPRSNTDGSLICRRGTIVLESTCAFTNLSSIVASSEGQITVEAGAAINPKATLDLSDSAVFTVGEGCVVTVETAKVGSKWLKPAEYVCSEAGRPNLAGSGRLRVLSDGAPSGISVIIR